MSTQIHPYLLARLIAVQEAFSQHAYGARLAPKKPTLPASTPKQDDDKSGDDSSGSGGTRGLHGKTALPGTTPKKGNSWKDIIKEDDKSGDGSSGGGTMRGLRGKQAEMAKASMRKLSRR